MRFESELVSAEAVSFIEDEDVASEDALLVSAAALLVSEWTVFDKTWAISRSATG